MKSEGKLKAKGIIPVDIFGIAADYDAINPIAEREGLFVIEDAAQSIGGSYKGRKNGSLATCAATSFYPAKPLGCYGDGGAVFTNDDRIKDLMHSIRVHGQSSDKYNNVRLGLTARLDSIQAAVVLAKLPTLDEEIANLKERRKRAVMNIERRAKRDHRIKARNFADRVELDKELNPNQADDTTE